MFNLWNGSKDEETKGLLHSTLHDEITFYPRFIQDLEKAKKEVIIESPFISSSRMQMLYPLFEKLIKRNIKVYIFTRNPSEHTDDYNEQAEFEIQRFEKLGVQVLICTGNHHRKLAIIDREILWEGSLNILSQIHSREIMRRIESKHLALEVFNFLKLKRFI